MEPAPSRASPLAAPGEKLPADVINCPYCWIAHCLSVYGSGLTLYSVNLKNRDHLHSISDNRTLRFTLRSLRGYQTWEWDSRGRGERRLPRMLPGRHVSIQEHQESAAKSLEAEVGSV